VEKILKTSKAFSLVFIALMFIFPTLIIALWCKFLPESFSYKYIPLDINLNTVPLELRISAMLLSMIPTGIIVFCFYYLHQLFKLYANKQFFEHNNIRLIKMIGMTLVLNTFSWLIVQPCLTYILRLNLQPENRVMTITIDSADISNLIIGGILILVSWIMNEARKNEEELALIV
jgi:hypothetical protein